MCSSLRPVSSALVPPKMASYSSPLGSPAEPRLAGQMVVPDERRISGTLRTAAVSSFLAPLYGLLWKSHLPEQLCSCLALALTFLSPAEPRFGGIVRGPFTSARGRWFGSGEPHCTLRDLARRHSCLAYDEHPEQCRKLRAVELTVGTVACCACKREPVCTCVCVHRVN